MRVGADATDIIDNAVLFSAHFDCVPTSFGATDDGMSVVALLQLLSYLAEHRPRRTAIFNLNNGEEDGLNGAQTYVQLHNLASHSSLGNRFLAHPWSNLTTTFLNVEG